MLIIVVHRVRSGYELLSKGGIGTGIQISIETREIAAADFKPQYVPFAKNIARSPQVELEFVYLPRVHQLGLLLGIPVTRSNDSLG
jgi:hypothetical protein